LYECATNQQINSIVPSEDHSGSFIYYVLEKSATHISELAGKQAVPIVNKTVFGTFEVIIPRLPEQQKIAACLSFIDELITAQSKKIDALKVHKRGLMQQLFPMTAEVQG
jgi:type I restriction enzyme S subunit